MTDFFKNIKPANIGIALLVCAVLQCATLFLPLQRESIATVAAVMSIMFLLTAMYLAGRVVTSGYLGYAFMLTAVAASLFLRVCFFDFASNDYLGALSPWVETFRNNGGFAGLALSFGDYNVPYMYLLAFFSYFDFSDLYLIKFSSIIFDMVLAAAVMGIVELISDNKRLAAGSFLAALLLPTVWLNSACWAQCDSMLFGLAILALYYGLRDRPALCVVILALAFSIKLQAIFLVPILLVLIIAGKMKFRHAFLFPAVFLLTALPSVIAGRPILDVLSIHLRHTQMYDGWLVLNAPSAFAILSENASSSAFYAFKYAGIAIAFIFVLCLMYCAFVNREKLTNRNILTIALLLGIGIPWLLPAMHDRYFFLADALGLAYAALNLRARWFIPLLTFIGSFAAYNAYLFGTAIMEMRTAAILTAAAAGFVIYDLAKSFKQTEIPLKPASKTPRSGRS